jgi:uncharacterized surface protein with fasciclin (FAS1) repeats
MTTIERAMAAAGFGTFSRLLGASPYSEIVESGGPYTIFAPVETAFERFPPGTVDRLTQGDDALLRAVVGIHFAAGKVLSSRLVGRRIRAVMYAGEHLIIDGKLGLKVNGANLVKPDVLVGECVIHGIDTVLWPREQVEAAL